MPRRPQIYYLSMRAYTVTYDPKVLSATEAQELAQMYEQQIELARKESS